MKTYSLSTLDRLGMRLGCDRAIHGHVYRNRQHDHGLGPTKPGVGPGQPFPTSPLQPVNSPVQVLVNGEPGDVSYSGGYPGAVDGYQVNFRLPDDTAPGMASIQLTSTWIGGQVVSITAQ